MTASSDVKHLEITVTNFGPIAEGKIELRPMTVFVGPSNTGKSYMAALIYALHKSLAASPPNPDTVIFPKQLYQERLKANLDEFPLSVDEIEQVLDWLKETVSYSQSADGFPPAFLELHRSVSSRIRSILENGDYLIRHIDSELSRCFGVDNTQQLARYPLGGNFAFSVGRNRLSKIANESRFEYRYEITSDVPVLEASVPETLPVPIGNESNGLLEIWQWLIYMFKGEPEKRRDAANRALSILATECAFNMIDPLSRPAFYLPADRAGVMHAHQVVVRALIAGASRSPLRPDMPLPSVSGVLGDFLEQLVAFAGATNQASGTYTYDVLAKKLEYKLLRGAIRAERSEIDYPSFTYRPIGWRQDLPLKNTSSMVSELAPVVLYLRHVVQPGNLLIIEEPEAHLHPEMQARFTRLLVAAVQSGIRILITTHSEWILEELANLVRLSELPLDRRDRIGDPEIAISPDELGTWFFEPDEVSNGSVVREISLDEDLATFPAGFGLVTESLYNRWVDISNLIQEGDRL